MNNNWLIEAGSTVYIFTWLGDKANNALVALLVQYGYMVGNDGGVKTLSISSMAYNDADDNCLYIATTKAP